MSLSLNSPLHPHISFSDTLQAHQPIHWRQSDMSLVLTFRLVHSDSLWFLLYYFLPHFPSFSSVGSLGTNFNLKHFLPAQPLTAVTDIGESVRRGTPLNFWIINNSNCCCGKKTRTCLSAGITLQCGENTVKLRLVFEPVTVYSHLSVIASLKERKRASSIIFTDFSMETTSYSLFSEIQGFFIYDQTVLLILYIDVLRCHQCNVLYTCHQLLLLLGQVIKGEVLPVLPSQSSVSTA